MSKLRRLFLPMEALMMLEESADKVYFDGEPTTPTPRPKPKPFDQQLSDKGLQRFEINGVEIIAHNEKEAQKRYKKRYK